MDFPSHYNLTDLDQGCQEQLNSTSITLYLTLSSKFGRSKSIITTMPSFTETHSYDDVLRSAAKAAITKRSYHGISDASEGFGTSSSR